MSDENSPSAATRKALKEPHDRHPALKGWPVGVWSPGAVGKVRGYPRTLELYERQREQLRANSEAARNAGRLTRLGVPNGWAGRRMEIDTARRNSRTAAEMLVTEMDRLGYWKPDNRESRLIMTEVMGIIVSPLSTVCDRMTAMRMALTYIQPKPMQRVTLAVAGGAFGLAEAWAAAGARLIDGTCQARNVDYSGRPS